MSSEPLDAVIRPPRTARFRAVVPSKQNRSLLSNCAVALPGSDGRSAEARRFRDLVVAYLAPLGDIDSLPADVIALGRSAAALAMKSEQMQAQIVEGVKVNHDDLARTANALSRALSTLRRLRTAPTKGPSLIEAIAARHRKEAE